MLFHITQTHKPELCPVDEGGPQSQCNPGAAGIKVHHTFYSFAEHITFYVVEADTMEAVHRFLRPGFRWCDCRITAVSSQPIFM